MYKPSPGTPVTWVWQDGRHAITTHISDTTDISAWTHERVIARYGDPRPALRNRPDVLTGSGLTLEQALTSPLGMTFFRFALDPVKGILPAAIRRASQTPGNRYNIEPLDDNPLLSLQQAHDVAACLCGKGELSQFIREFAPNMSGFSMDRNNPTRISLPNPPFGLFSTQFAGQTIWMFNDWRGEEPGGAGEPKPSEPEQPKSPMPTPEPDSNQPNPSVPPLMPQPTPTEPTPQPVPQPTPTVPDTSSDSACIPKPEYAHLLEIKRRYDDISTQLTAALREVKKTYPTGGGGRFVRAIRDMASRLLTITLLVILSSVLTGCAAFRALVPGGVTASDSEWSGIKSGEPVSITASLDQRAALLEPVLALLGQDDPLGVLLPITLVGETQPRWIICDQQLVTKCRAIPLNAEVHFAGSAVGPGVLWKPKRLTAEDFND